MDKLPDLILIKILNNLTINNQINLRLLNKRFKLIIDDNLSNSKKELILFFKLLPIRAIWQYNQEQINLKNSIVFNEKIKNSNYFKNLFCKNIRRLCLFFKTVNSTSEPKNIKWMFIINEFIDLCSSLIHLQIQKIYRNSYSFTLDEININLPNLKTLFVDSCKIKNVNLNCPNLIKLSAHYKFEMSDKFDQIRNSLKFLKVASFTCLPGYTLPNLEIIYFCGELNIDISHFEKLKEIHYFREFYAINMERMVGRLNGFLYQKKKYNRECLEIFFEGIKFRSDTIDLIKALSDVYSLGFTGRIDISKSIIKLYLNNQLKVDNLKKRIVFSSELLKDIEKMNYNQIDNLSKCLVSAELNWKHNFQSEIKFSNYEFKLINLLKNVRKLGINPSIFYLNIQELNKFAGLFTNLAKISCVYMYQNEIQFSHFYFRFLTNFRELKTIVLFDQMISIEELGIIIEELKQLESIGIIRWLNFNQLTSYNEEPEKEYLRIKIIRDYENNYQIEFSSKKDEKLKIFESKNEFLIYLKEKERLKEKFYDNFLDNDYNINFNLINISKEQYFYLQEH